MCLQKTQVHCRLRAIKIYYMVLFFPSILSITNVFLKLISAMKAKIQLG